MNIITILSKPATIMYIVLQCNFMKSYLSAELDIIDMQSQLITFLITILDLRTTFKHKNGKTCIRTCACITAL